MSEKFKAGVLTMSDKGARGERIDESGEIAADILKADGFDIVKTGIVPDRIEVITGTLLDLIDNKGLILIRCVYYGGQVCG